MTDASEMVAPMTPQELLAVLKDKGFETSTAEHEAVFTVEESKKVQLQVEGGHTKNLFVKDKKDNYFLLVIEQNAQVKLNHLHKVIGAKSRLSFGKPDKLMEYLGVKPGSVTAFSVINDRYNAVKVFIDQPLLEHAKINCHPLTNEMTTTISREDLLEFLEQTGHKPEVIQLSETGDAELT